MVGRSAAISALTVPNIGNDMLQGQFSTLRVYQYICIYLSLTALRIVSPLLSYIFVMRRNIVKRTERQHTMGGTLSTISP